MRTKHLALIVITSLPFSFQSLGQSIIGFWEVNEVMVGDRNLTPVAKWFIYEENNTYRAGNGWTQNDIGTWAYNEESMEFLPTSRNGPDEFGAFKVKFSEDKMFWGREEEGMMVSITLSKIKEMPMAPADSISAQWDLLMVKKGNEEVTSEFDPNNLQNITIRNSKTYKMTNGDGTEAYGYWHMDAHNPEFHLIDFNKEVDFNVFIVSFKNDLLLMRPKGDDDLVFIYKKK